MLPEGWTRRFVIWLNIVFIGSSSSIIKLEVLLIEDYSMLWRQHSEQFYARIVIKIQHVSDFWDAISRPDEELTVGHCTDQIVAIDLLSGEPLDLS